MSADKLTPREQEVARLLEARLGLDAIAARLKIRRRTVIAHKNSLLNKSRSGGQLKGPHFVIQLYGDTLPGEPTTEPSPPKKSSRSGASGA